jgi:hypothetical protein
MRAQYSLTRSAIGSNGAETARRPSSSARRDCACKYSLSMRASSRLTSASSASAMVNRRRCFWLSIALMLASIRAISSSSAVVPAWRPRSSARTVSGSSMTLQTYSHVCGSSTLTRTPLASQVRERLVRGTRVDATVGAAKCARLVLATLNTGKLSSRLCRGGTRAAV